MRDVSDSLRGYERVIAAFAYWIINRSVKHEFFIQVHSRT